MNRLARILALALILVCAGMSGASAAEYKSFVDEFVYSPFLFEEDPADEFLAEKQEINRLYEREFNRIYKEHNFYDRQDASKLYEEYEIEPEDGFEGADGAVIFYTSLQTKIRELIVKEESRYGEKYVDIDVAFAACKIFSMTLDAAFEENFYSKQVDSDEKIKDRLRDENGWKEREVALHQALKDLSGSSIIIPEIRFVLDRGFVEICRNHLGEEDPVTLKRKIELIQDYSVMGDSKVALEMSKDLLPKIEAAFGAKSLESATVLNLMAYDYKTLGNYRASEETLLKLIDLNSELHGEESSAALADNLVELIKLRKATPMSDPMLYDALKKAAKNLPKEEMEIYKYYIYAMSDLDLTGRLHYFDPVFFNNEKFGLLEEHRRDYPVKSLDNAFENSEFYRTMGYYSRSLLNDIQAMFGGKAFFGKHHHKVLMFICNLSNDYLNLNQPEEALALAQQALEMSHKTYGDDHPRTVFMRFTV